MQRQFNHLNMRFGQLRLEANGAVAVICFAVVTIAFFALLAR